MFVAHVFPWTRCTFAAAAAAAAALCWTPLVDALIVGAAVIPHGDFAYDPALANFSRSARELHTASLRAGRFVVEDLEPEVIFLTTPHGLELTDDFLIYENSHLAGAASVGGDVPHGSTYSVAMSMTTDVSLATSLRARLAQRGFNVTGLLGFSDSQPLPVNWGEILPLSFVAASAQRAGLRLPPVLIVSIPYRRTHGSAAMVPEMLELGAAVADLLQQDARRIAWIVSADLAHTHLASGPYGYCACAQRFDDAAGAWLRALESEALVARAAREQALGAMACGFTGLVLLEGAVAASGRHTWSSELWAIAAPTYYGMAVAGIRRQAGKDLVV